MKTLYLHIGTQKTATTSIQRFCIDNAEALDAQGAAYPLMPFCYDNTGLARNGNFLLGRGTPTLVKMRGRKAHLIAPLDADIRRKLKRTAREARTLDAQAYDENAYDENAYEENAYEENSYVENTYDENAYEENSYEENSYVENTYEENAYEENSYEENAYDENSGARGKGLPRRADWPKWLEIGLDVVAAAFESHDTVILSDEVIWASVTNGNDEFWEPLLAHADEHAYDVRVIVYLRRQDAYLASDYNQHVKAADGRLGCISFRRFLRRAAARRLDYHATLEKIASHIGRDHVTVRVYDRDALDARGGVFADFLAAAGLALDESFAMPDHDLNTVSLTPNLLAVKRAVNASEQFSRCCKIPSREAAELCRAGMDRQVRRRLLSSSQAEQLLEQFAAGNDAIARDYLHRDGPLFDTTVEDARSWHFGSPRMADVAIAYYCTWNSIQNCMLDPRLGEPEAPLVTDGARELWTGPRPGGAVTRAALDALADFFCRRQSDIASGAARELYSQEGVITFARALFAGAPLDEALPFIRATATPIPFRTRLKNLVSGITP